MALANLLILQVLFISDSGRMVNKMVTAMKDGMIIQNTRVNIKMEGRKALVYSNGLTNQPIRGSGFKIRFMALELISGLTKESILAKVSME